MKSKQGYRRTTATLPTTVSWLSLVPAAIIYIPDGTGSPSSSIPSQKAIEPPGDSTSRSNAPLNESIFTVAFAGRPEILSDSADGIRNGCGDTVSSSGETGGSTAGVDTLLIPLEVPI